MERREKEICEKEERRERPAAWRKVFGKVWDLLRRTARDLVSAVLAAGEKLTEDTICPRSVAAVGLALAVPAFSLLAALAKFPPGVYPAGFALVCAVGGSGQHRFRGLGEKMSRLLDLGLTAGVFLGAALSCLWIGPRGFFYFLTYLVAVMVRAAVTGGRFTDGAMGRVTLATACGAGLGLLFSWMDGFSITSVLAAVNMALITPVFTYLLCGFYIYSAALPRGSVSTRQRVYLDATGFALLFLCIYSLREVEGFGLSLSYVLGVVLTMAVAYRAGALYGAGCGLICGMATATASLAPSLAVAGFFAGLFFDWSAPVGVAVSFLAACGWAMVSGEFRLFGQVTADYLVALILFVPVHHFLPRREEGEEKIRVREAANRETVHRAREKLRGMSEAFSSLSQVFYTVSDTMKKPQLTETSRLISDCCRELCSRCAISALCWGSEQSETGSSTVQAAARLLGEGRVKAEDFSKPFTTRCPNLEELVDLVNRRFLSLGGEGQKNNRTSLLAGEYSSVARLLKSCAGDMGKELEYNPRLQERVGKVLQELGVKYRRAAVFGEREMRIDVYGVALDRGKLDNDSLLAAFQKEFHCLFEAPAFLMLEETVILRLRRRRRITLECAKSGCTKKGEVMNGDSVALFENDRDRFYTLICDGMGSGREAAFTSRLASLFLEKLMLCATPKSVTLEMLNTFLMSKTDETFSTVDLLEVDLLTGEGNFIKAGAAPSFVLRGDRVHRIQSHTPPAGVLSKLCAEETRFQLREGDLVVMVSDGALEDDDEEPLLPLLSVAPRDNAAAACDFLFRDLRERANFRDDLSLCVVRVLNAE